MKQRGQSFVEFALVAPILVFLLIGVFEVGWVLRTHLILANASREAARFSARPDYLAFDTASYNRVVSHTINSISGQIEFEKYGTEIISVVQINVQLVCDPANVDANDKLVCDCQSAVTDPYSQTLVMTPLTVSTFTHTYPATSTKQTKLDYVKIVDSVVPTERLIGCSKQLHGHTALRHQIVIVELFYDQPQLFGFPVVSNPYTDPFPQYTSTTMRILISRK